MKKKFAIAQDHRKRVFFLGLTDGFLLSGKDCKINVTAITTPVLEVVGTLYRVYTMQFQIKSCFMLSALFLNHVRSSYTKAPVSNLIGSLIPASCSSSRRYFSVKLRYLLRTPSSSYTIILSISLSSSKTLPGTLGKSSSICSNALANKSPIISVFVFRGYKSQRADNFAATIIGKRIEICFGVSLGASGVPHTVINSRVFIFSPF